MGNFASGIEGGVGGGVAEDFLDWNKVAVAPLRRGGSFSGFVERRPIAGIVAWLYHNGPIGMLSVSFQLYATLRRRHHPRPFSILYIHTHTHTHIYLLSIYVCIYIYIYIHTHTHIHSALSYSLLPSFVINPFFRLASIHCFILAKKFHCSYPCCTYERGCHVGYANRVTDFHPWKSHNLWERRQYSSSTPLLVTIADDIVVCRFYVT